MRVVPLPVCQSSRWMSVAVTATSIRTVSPSRSASIACTAAMAVTFSTASINPLPPWGRLSAAAPATASSAFDGRA